MSEENLSKWIPLESNPDVLNEWLKKAGLVTSSYELTDVYGLDPDMLSLVPQPVKAVILLFPITESSETRRRNDEARLQAEGQDPPVDPSVFWMRQTIPNACGTIGLIHAVANAGAEIRPDSAIAKFLAECKGKTPGERAHLLEATSHFASIHANAATSGQSAVPTNLDTNLHFTCFVQAPSPKGQRLIELDGRRTGPMDRGECPGLLAAAAVWVKSHYVESTTSMQFSMLALAAAPPP